MTTSYEFGNKIVLRTPRLPFTNQLNEEEIKKIINDISFLEAIYLASPILHDECIKWQKGEIDSKKDIQKIIRSVYKYYSRMTSRCTPFGLFSGCTVVGWEKDTSMMVLCSSEIKRHTRFDMHYLCALAQRIAILPEVKKGLLYFPNTSIYTIGNEIRYVEYKYLNTKRNHNISSVVASEYLTEILKSAENGITIDMMIQQLLNEDVTEEDAMEFVEELINAQLLTNELEPAITGEEFIYQIIKVLKKNKKEFKSISDIINVLEKANTLIINLDKDIANNAVEYRKIMSLLQVLEVPFEENKLFQTDVIKLIDKGGVNESIKSHLQNSLEALNKLTFSTDSPNLQSFAIRFHERYENNEMPLLEVLDTETGIGYLENSNNDIVPLIENIFIPSKEKNQQIAWGKLENFLKEKLLYAQKNNALSIEIQESELNTFNSNWHDLPPSLSIMFRIIDNDNTIYIEGVNGSSAANLLGRFAHADPAINKIVCDVTNAEQTTDPDIIFAEVIHLPESRIGNVLLHPVFREYEIPYLAKSSLDKTKQIDLQDLYISVKNKKVILYSKRLNKQIIPRLSTAHNYSHNALPVYQLLCDLQNQGKRAGLRFSWGSLAIQNQFLPRVSYKGVILQAATWNFTKKDIHFLTNPLTDFVNGIKEFRTKWLLPRCVVLADGDNELLVDFENQMSIEAWSETIKKRNSFILKEFFFSSGTPIIDEKGSSYANQLVATLIKKSPSYNTDHQHRLTINTEAVCDKRKFSPGSEWLYYKLYCGVKSADKILLESINPLTEKLLEKGMIDKWFFIRYNDPAFHLRLRVHITDLNKMGEIIQLIRYHLLPFENDGYVWKLQSDTYNREFERYGKNTIELAESIFYYDSISLVKMLDCTWGDERENVRWLWGMRSVDELLNVFQFSLLDKLTLLTHLKNAFASEFNMNKILKTQLNDKHRNNRKRIEEFMSKNKTEANHQFVCLLKEKNIQLNPIALNILQLNKRGELQIPLPDLIGSYIHMLLNRIFTSNPRLQELVIYDFLFRHYQSLIAKQKIGIFEEINLVVT